MGFGFKEGREGRDRKRERENGKRGGGGSGSVSGKNINMQTYVLVGAVVTPRIPYACLAVIITV